MKQLICVSLLGLLGLTTVAAQEETVHPQEKAAVPSATLSPDSGPSGEALQVVLTTLENQEVRGRLQTLNDQQVVVKTSTELRSFELRSIMTIVPQSAATLATP